MVRISDELVVQPVERTTGGTVKEDGGPHMSDSRVREFLEYEIEYRPREGKELVTRVPRREVAWVQDGEERSYREQIGEATVVGHYRGHAASPTGEMRKKLGPQDEIPDGLDYIVYEFLSAPD